MPTKLTVNLPDATIEAIKSIADERGTTVTEALRQVIESQRFLISETQKGAAVLIQNPVDKTVQRIVFNSPPQVK